jgi:hypothetical protein
MAPLRFTVDVEGHPRTLFSVRMRNNGEITLGVTYPIILDREGVAASLRETPSTERVPVTQQYYSIHPSHSSPTGINVIKRTTRLANGKKISGDHYTKVIKEKENFAFLFTRRCGLLNRPNFIPRGTFEKASLGTYQPTSFTLIFGVIISAAETEFSIDKPDYFKRVPEPFFSIVQKEFENIRITVLSSFINLPSVPYWLTANVLTFRPEELEPGTYDIGNGLPSMICGRLFARHAKEFMLDLIERTEPVESRRLLAGNHVDLFPEGLLSADKFQRFSKDRALYRFLSAHGVQPYILTFSRGKA